MRILKSFDTKTDAEELLEAVEKYGEWNVILVKKHRVKLLLPLLSIFLALAVVTLMIYVIYTQLYKDYQPIFWMIAIVYGYTTLSWCVHSLIGIMWNIIWQTRSKKKYIDSIYRAEEKQRAFEKFLRHSFVTFTIHTLLIFLNASIPFILIHNTGIGSMATAFAIFIINLVFLVILNRVMFRIIDYEMNFNICTSDIFTSYTQDGFFKTNSMDISTSAIKVIQSSKEGLSGALLQYWNLYIHTDWDLNIKGGKTLELSYIPDPKNIAKKLNGMIEKNRDNWRNF